MSNVIHKPEEPLSASFHFGILDERNRKSVATFHIQFYYLHVVQPKIMASSALKFHQVAKRALLVGSKV